MSPHPQATTLRIRSSYSSQTYLVLSWWTPRYDAVSNMGYMIIVLIIWISFLLMDLRTMDWKWEMNLWFWPGWHFPQGRNSWSFRRWWLARGCFDSCTYPTWPCDSARNVLPFGQFSRFLFHPIPNWTCLLQPGFNMQDTLRVWFPKHQSEQVRKPLDAVIAALKADGVTRFGATGYCFGGTQNPFYGASKIM